MLLHAAWILLLQYLLPLDTMLLLLEEGSFLFSPLAPLGLYFRDTHKPPQLTHRMNSKNAIDRYRTVATPHEIFEFGDIMQFQLNGRSDSISSSVAVIANSVSSNRHFLAGDGCRRHNLLAGT